MVYRRRLTSKRTGYTRGGSTKVWSAASRTAPRAESTASLNVIADPFSLATTQAIIPDGKCIMSVGQRLQSIKEVQQTGVASAPLTCLLFPGLGNGISWFNTAKTTSTGSSSVLQPYTSHGSWRFEPGPEPAATTDPYTYVQAQQTSTTGLVSQWRIVSQGLRLSLTNNSDQNDGWWEAIRITPNNDATFWAFAQDGNEPETVDGRFTSPDDYVPDSSRVVAQGTAFAAVLNSNFADNPSYISGKLRDIHKHQFFLKMVNTDHDMRQLKTTYNLINGTVAHQPSGADGHDGYVDNLPTWSCPGAAVVSDGANVGELIAGNVDFSYDMVVIRIHGRPSNVDSSESINTPTRILSHIVSNQEVVYQENTFLERFHKRPAFDKAGLEMIDQMIHKAIKPAKTAAPETVTSTGGTGGTGNRGLRVLAPPRRRLKRRVRRVTLRRRFVRRRYK